MPAPQALRLPITMPSDPRRRSVCTGCLEKRLSGQRGVRSVKIVPAEDIGTGRPDIGFIELDYDPHVVSLSQINGYLRTADSCLSESVAHIVMPVHRIVSARHGQSIESRLNRLPGVRASVSHASQTIRLEFDRKQCALPQIVGLLEQEGVAVLPQRSSDGRGQPAGGYHHSKEAPAATFRLPQPGWLRTAMREQDIVLAVLAGLFLLAGFLVHITGGPQEIRVALLLVSYVCGGFYPAQDMIHTLAEFKLDIDLLMFAAAFGAASLGHYEEGAMLLFLFSLGGAGERLAINRARGAIKALADLSPQTAVLIQQDGSRREVPVEELRIGDRVLVAPGQRLPADGKIVSGDSAVDQSPITGESVPIDKAAGDPVFAGTINGDGALTVEVGKLASDNTLAKVVRMVEEAQTTKSPTQLFTDRVEKWYVPLVVIATVALIVLPPLAGLVPRREHASVWAGWFYQAMAFLTAASPCALAIGTPAAVLSGIARAARGGMLIKGGAHLENLGRVRAIAFDKTGTLTFGRPEATDIVPLAEDIDEFKLLSLACAVELGSRHPIAEAIVTAGEDRGCAREMAEDIDQTPGVGISGRVGGLTVTVGRPASFDASRSGADAMRQRAIELENAGRTVVAIGDSDRVLGLIGLADRARPEAKQMIGELKALGVHHTIMLTGDNPRTAAAIAQGVGIDQYLAELMPEDKVTRVRALDEKYGRVAMVGDGVNDAPAMANATVGIAIGGAAGSASDVALETADIALLADDLGKLPEAIGVSRYARKIIVQNLVIALGVIAVLAPLAALGGTPISAAVLFHEGSTVLVVVNSLRILAYRPAPVPAEQPAS
ncbi:MAG: heavy metal translocating P-type ATPase [Phycisphaerales bacterium]